VRQQVLDGDALPALALQLGDVARDRVAETKLPALDEYQRARRGRDDFRQTRQVEDGVSRHLLARGDERASAVSLAPDHAAAARDEHDGAGQLLLLNGFRHRPVDVGQPFGRHRDLRRRDARQRRGERLRDTRERQEEGGGRPAASRGLSSHRLDAAAAGAAAAFNWMPVPRG
jgi:hypothetical protein